MENILEIILTISITLNVIFIYTTANMLIKNEKFIDVIELYIDFIERIQLKILQSNEKLKEIDQKGTFSSDDEIGWFFDNIKNIQEELNFLNTTLININDKKEKEK